MAVIAVPPSRIGIFVVDFFSAETVIGVPGLPTAGGAKMTFNFRGGSSDRLVMMLEEEEASKTSHNGLRMQLNEVADSGTGLYRCDCGLQVTVLPRPHTGIGLNSFFNSGDSTQPGRFFPRIGGGFFRGSSHELAMGVRGVEGSLDARTSHLRKEDNISLPVPTAGFRTHFGITGEILDLVWVIRWTHS